MVYVDCSEDEKKYCLTHRICPSTCNRLLANLNRGKVQCLVYDIDITENNITYWGYRKIFSLRIKLK